MRRAIVAGLLAVAMASGTGCCCHSSFEEWVFSPFGPGTLADRTHCPPSCGPACGVCTPVCAEVTCDSCGCAPCGCDPCGCDPCGCDPCATRCQGPLSFVLGLLHPICWGCDGGCGEMYWGDFHGDPPDLCDPCDRCGNWTGEVYGSPAYQQPPGCSTCNNAPMTMTSPMESQSRIISETDEVVTPARRVPTKAAPQPVSPEAKRPTRAATRR